MLDAFVNQLKLVEAENQLKQRAFNQRIKPAVDKVNERRTVTKAAYDLRRSTETRVHDGLLKFHEIVATMAGAAIIASVTFLGYLRDSHIPLAYRSLLDASWFLLGVALITALYYRFFHMGYIHFAVQRGYYDQAVEQDEAEAEYNDAMAKACAELQLPVEPGCEEATNRIRNNAALKAVNNQHNVRKEKMHERLFVACEWITSPCFILGISLIIVFAAINTR